MRTSLHGVALALVLASPAIAQWPISSPRGYSFREADGVDRNILFARQGVRFQQVDSTLNGLGTLNLQSINFRRDGNEPNNPLFSARTIYMNVVMGHSFVTRIGKNLDANYNRTPTLAATTRRVDLPDFTTQPMTVPAPWDITIPFDQPFMYNGIEDLLWEIGYAGNSAVPSGGPRTVPYAIDYKRDVGDLVNTSNYFQFARVFGCRVPGFSNSMQLTGQLHNRRTTLGFEFDLNYAPPQTQVFLNVDIHDPMIMDPMVCAQIRAGTAGTVLMGITDATGRLGARYYEGFPYDPSLQLYRFYAQAVAADPSQSPLPFALSNPIFFDVPTAPATPPPQFAFIYSRIALSYPFVYGPYPGGVVAMFQY